jgi:hypothetical protein
MVTEAFDVIYSDSSTERAVVRALGLEGGLGVFFSDSCLRRSVLC